MRYQIVMCHEKMSLGVQIQSGVQWKIDWERQGGPPWVVFGFIWGAIWKSELPLSSLLSHCVADLMTHRLRQACILARGSQLRNVSTETWKLHGDQYECLTAFKDGRCHSFFLRSGLWNTKADILIVIPVWREKNDRLVSQLFPWVLTLRSSEYRKGYHSSSAAWGYHLCLINTYSKVSTQISRTFFHYNGVCIFSVLFVCCLFFCVCAHQMHILVRWVSRIGTKLQWVAYGSASILL